MNIIQKNIDEIVPYAKNAKKHDKKQIANVAESIRQYGFVQPVVVDRDGVIVIGHCRTLAAKKLGMKEVPCVCVDELTPEQVAALRLVDNKSNESDWDMDLLGEELAQLDLSAFHLDFSFAELPCEEPNDDGQYKMTDSQRDQEFRERMERGELSDDDEEYQEFLKKFEAKKTTDDCYTPENIYDCVKKWVLKEYRLGKPPIVRPFYPGGSYQNEHYPKGCIVIDNPPFSIISEICAWYTERNIPYFLFAPTLTLLGIMKGEANYVAVGAQVVYENGAQVNTSFVTNLGADKILAASELRKKMDEENKKNLAKQHKQLPNYSYPNEVITATMLCQLAKYGETFRLNRADVAFIRGLDAQKKCGKGVFGSGFLLSEKAAAEKKNTDVWELSPREMEIVKKLGIR